MYVGGAGRLPRAPRIPAVAKRGTRSFSGAPFGIQFPVNSAAKNNTDPYAVLEFANPHTNGLPIWGLGGAGITVVRVIQTPTIMPVGYMAGFWWSRGDGLFDNDDVASTHGNWGWHGYPVRGWQIPNSYGSSPAVGHFIHELATSSKDIIDASGTVWAGQNSTFDGTNWGVVTGQRIFASRVYVQGLRINRVSATNKVLRAYNDLPSVADADCCQITLTDGNSSASYGEGAIPSPKFTMGDSPWYARTEYQHERWGCLLIKYKIFNALLSESDMLLEASDFSQIVTSAGQAAIWHGRNGFDSSHVTDNGTIPCSYGTGISFTIKNPGTLAADQLSLVPRTF